MIRLRVIVSESFAALRNAKIDFRRSCNVSANTPHRWCVDLAGAGSGRDAPWWVTASPRRLTARTHRPGACGQAGTVSVARAAVPAIPAQWPAPASAEPVRRRGRTPNNNPSSSARPRRRRRSTSTPRLATGMRPHQYCASDRRHSAAVQNVALDADDVRQADTEIDAATRSPAAACSNHWRHEPGVLSVPAGSGPNSTPIRIRP